MISVFQTNVLNPIQLFFGGSKREACMVADPEEFEWNYRASSLKALDGMYWIDGVTLEDANYVFDSQTGDNRFYSPGVAGPKIADLFGNTAQIMDTHIPAGYSNSSVTSSYLSNKNTWAAANTETFKTQIIYIFASGGSQGTAYGYGSMYHKLSTLTDVSSTNNASMTKYRSGAFKVGYNSKKMYAVDMGIVGEYKSGIATDEVVGSGGPYHAYTASNTNVRTDFDIYAANGVSNYATINRYNVELMYLTPAQMTAGDASVATTSYYIQYDTSGGYGKDNGAFAQFSYPRDGVHICNNTALNGSYHHGFWHGHQQSSGALLGTFNSRLLIKSDTPSATQGADNGSGDIGWYKQTGASTVWTYFSGAKWTIDKTL